ncbi:hypothetical protein OKA05_05880 [Luteolibacter arcticus]|uniref:Uncharacterized protein n=1 Tax=Luteolibacter arcticus TaxID=1581411 RepID=A0ABT3GEM6_9BACT|nr:hypothetical protein [Luteolibacter arcticus]MCW1922073.1 hypothetical protein [Luteolibacter arcticus]
MMRSFLTTLAFLTTPLVAEPVQLSGIYPQLAMFNNEGECGTGAVVPWADRLWVVTYAPHAPKGSSDKLYEITPDLEQIVRPESIGGTPANRMIHRESNQLFIGPYAVSAEGKVRAIPYSKMFGRPTGNARHLTDPSGKIYYASMEEALYEVDVKTLEVTELFRDEAAKGGHKANLPGYHGKGLYSSQGLLVYANNGEYGGAAQSLPETSSGVLATWDGKASGFDVVRRNQFTEVTGPGGIYGNSSSKDPIWTMGWDHRSLILMLLDGDQWQSFRLPKGSHSYDGAHGWNTEWPRIREIGEGDKLLATMHGTFWTFPKTFSAKNTAGIAPRSNYLKVIGDFARWNDRIVFGCDDTAKAEFLNKRKAKGEIAAPQSQSNLWFTEPDQLDHLGPVIGRGALWVREDVKSGTTSDPFLISGYARKGLHLASASKSAIALEVDEDGTGSWKKVREIEHAGGCQWIDLSGLKGTWLRLIPSAELSQATASFAFSNSDERSSSPDPIFNGLASADEKNVTGGLVRAREGNKRTLAFAAMGPDARNIGCYELQADLTLSPADDKLLAHTNEHTKIPVGVISSDAASVVFVDDNGKRWRLPKGDAAFDQAGPLGDSRAAREVATERDLFNAHGTFYELPANNAGGFAKLRPVTTHNRRIHDFCSYRGLFIMTGVGAEASQENQHLIHSADGKAVLWAGAIDDIWKMGKPRGQGGPWKDSAVTAGAVSDPYLMTAYDKKSLTLASDQDATITAEIDISGDGNWVTYQSFKVTVGKPLAHEFPDAFSAYWIRFTSDKGAKVTAQLDYR